MDKQIISHKHLIKFELLISELGIRGRIEFEEAIMKAMEEYKDVSIKEFKREIDRL
jgi:hypothetical protein